MITQKEPEIKEFLQRSDIKTMRRDIKRLREADVVFESEKIMKMAEKQEPELIDKKEKEEFPILAKPQIKNPSLLNIKIQNIEELILPEDFVLIETEKNKISEENKQKVFLLESQRKEYKNNFEKISQQQKLIQKEIESNLEKKQRILEKIEGLLDESQKNQKWEEEEKISVITNQINKLEENKQGLQKEKENIINKLKGINKSLKEVSREKIIQEEIKIPEKTQENNLREESKSEEVIIQEKPQESNLKEESKPKEERLQFAVNPPKIHEQVSEKLQKELGEEEKIRRKFIEDIEMWANSN